MRIGIDLMGSDHAPPTILDAILHVQQEANGCTLIAIVQEDKAPPLKKAYPTIEFLTAPESIEMEDHPLHAVRRKKDSTMALGVKLLNTKELDAFLSAGNTGALVAVSHLYLSKLPTIKAPALCVLIPKERETMAVLDVGANISFKPEHLLDYAKMAIVYKTLLTQRKPKVALLNIGIEEQKGTKEVQEGFTQLVEYFSTLEEATFLGNVEAREVFQRDVDLPPTDGFTGNVFLKTCEGVSSFLMDYLKKADGSQELVKRLYERFNYSAHPGAVLLGVDGLVIKCHGYSNSAAWVSGIKGALHLVSTQLIERIKERL